MTNLKIFTGLILIFLTNNSLANDENDIHTIKYSAEDFDDEVAKKNHFIMFYAPWCGHCQRLHPTWEQLAEMLNEDDSNIKIAKVDCTTDGTICSKHDITGYPTLKFFKAGNPNPEGGIKFRGIRDLPTLTTFINEQLRDGQEDVLETVNIPKKVNGLTELTEDNFDHHTRSGKHFIKFYAPWCGHCQKLAPAWEQLAKSLEFEASVSISKVDCTQFRSICNLYDVKGYPTILWIEDGKKVEKYTGERTHEDLKQYVNKMLGDENQIIDEGIPREDINSGSAVGVLVGPNFSHGISNGITFVKFFAPWCGHCKRLAPTWEELGAKFVASDHVHIVKVDCTLEANKELCNEQEVEGFPTIFLYRNGEKVSEYSGSRTLDDLYDFVIKYVPEKDHDEL